MARVVWDVVREHQDLRRVGRPEPWAVPESSGPVWMTAPSRRPRRPRRGVPTRRCCASRRSCAPSGDTTAGRAKRRAGLREELVGVGAVGIHRPQPAAAVPDPSPRAGKDPAAVAGVDRRAGDRVHRVPGPSARRSSADSSRRRPSRTGPTSRRRAPGTGSPARRAAGTDEVHPGRRRDGLDRSAARASYRSSWLPPASTFEIDRDVAPVRRPARSTANPGAAAGGDLRGGRSRRSRTT